VKVDVHAHCYPDFYVEELKKRGKAEGGIGIGIPVWPGTQERMAEMDKLRVDVHVIGLSAPDVYFGGPEFSRGLAKATNDFIAGICRDYPGRFLGLASVPLLDVDDALYELDRAIGALQMDGVILGTNIDGLPLSAERFFPLLQEVDRRNIPVVLHPMRGIAEDMMPAEGVALSIPSNVGFIFETTRTIAEMTFKGTFERLRNITFVLPHAGGAIPFLYPRWDTSYRRQPPTHPMRKVPEMPSHYLRRHYYDTALNYYPSSLRCVADFVGVDHMLLGTDYPYTADFRARETIEHIEAFGFTEEEKEKIFSGNAAGIFPRLRSI
jgi:predicted TIM-barrel fold metal-dependent hydrolase